IRGGSTPSPVITIGSEQIQQEGFSDLGEVIRSVPQNFSGGQNPGVAGVSSGSNSNQNITGGSGIDLRGLGPDATLTLLNGRRMSYGGFSQAVDISAIPVEAVERIEIVPDGASAVYGSDAVGGVTNVTTPARCTGLRRYGRAAIFVVACSACISRWERPSNCIWTRSGTTGIATRPWRIPAFTTPTT